MAKQFCCALNMGDVNEEQTERASTDPTACV